MNSNFFDAAKKRDLEWATWKQGDKVYSIPAKTAVERAGEESEARAPRPEDYVKA